MKEAENQEVQIGCFGQLHEQIERQEGEKVILGGLDVVRAELGRFIGLASIDVEVAPGLSKECLKWILLFVSRLFITDHVHFQLMLWLERDSAALRDSEI